ncbi:L-threonylcarbamoyladenylate synthase [Egbenema bharatensis]|uniref:L-threonylcarbamoyladenylate synthase n=1 Tax=Egbenema bharatensis TaxID=3463334 RepID=UPI003A855CFC
MPLVPLTQLLHAARSGTHLISFPTDTVPALAVRPDRAALIFAAKQRSQTKPLILMGGDSTDLWPYVKGSEAELALWQQVAEQYWPGALTLVLPASDRLPPAMNPTDPTTIGIRVPNHPIARHLLSLTQPLATTSVNRSGEPPLETLSEINQHFPEVLTLHPQELERLEEELEPESSLQPNNKTPKTSSGVPSTVVKWTGQGWEVLRQGGIAWQG